jgi:uncharacterized protein YbdZ (MbtH family)
MKYTRIHPRRRAFGRVDIAASAGVAGTLQLFNSSNYAEYLLLWDFVIGIGVATSANLSVTQTNLALTAAVVTPFVPFDAPPPGLLFGGTTATVITPQYEYFLSVGQYIFWPHDWPLLLIPAGYYLTIQPGSNNARLVASVIWSAITPEQLDEDRWLQANAALLPQNG